MRHRLRHYWHEFRDAQPGQRFRQRYHRREVERAKGGAQWSRLLLIALACLCILIAIPLMVLPGPAVVFYALAGFLVAGESGWVATFMDRGELQLRRLLNRFRKTKQRRRSRSRR